jgi:hypothetical protein
MSTKPDDATVARAASSTPQPRHLAPDVRFTPGTLVGERYRIVSLLGEGGMGEVYRADDIRLGQRVALKYVPARLANDGGALERLIHEVRIGRTISHPNVCRMYDIVETEGHRFIAMEYVDGEDLASLLRRIGRLPSAKAVSIARDVCSGLAAAHDKGIVHRDLKPANIMVDGRGSARITDFGLAAIADDLASSSSAADVAGTPAYMAPEQLAGGVVSPRSDIYALGLVLYETFTGKRLFDASSIDQIRKQHLTTKSRPSAHAPDIDPAVERLILRCLEEDPAQRPPSMQAVVAALPGGDPLQAALAAGETPSPQMIAAAGEVGELPAGRAWLLLGTFAALLIALAWLTGSTTVLGFMSGVRSRAVLEDRARTVIRALGYTPGADDASWYVEDREYLNWLVRNDRSPSRWRALSRSQPWVTAFEYRDRQGPLVPRAKIDGVTRNDPAPNVAGDTSVMLDQEGRLLRFARVPDQRALVQPVAADWRGVFGEAGLNPSRFTPVPPEWTAPVGSDRRYAWTGTYANGSPVRVRVEAASLGGRPVYFDTFHPWDKPRVLLRPSIGSTVLGVISFTAIIAGAIIVRRNAALGRLDRRGALRVGITITLLYFGAYSLLANHVPDVYVEYVTLLTALGISMYSGLFGAVLYAAVEPFVRRRWPRMLIGWSRLLAGRFRDPLVGREVLVGVTAGSLMAVIFRAVLLAGITAGAAIPLNPLSMRHVNAPLPFAYAIARHAAVAIGYTVATLIVLLLLRLAFRSTPVAVAGAVILYGLVGTQSGPMDFVGALIAGSILLLLLFRSGALTLCAAAFSYFALRYVPLTLYFGEPYAGLGLMIAAAVVAVAVLAFHISLGGKPVFGAIAAEDEGTP